MGCFEFLTSFVILALMRKPLKCQQVLRSGFGSSLRFRVFVMSCDSFEEGSTKWGQGIGVCSGSWGSFTVGLAKPGQAWSWL